MKTPTNFTYDRETDLDILKQHHRFLRDTHKDELIDYLRPNASDYGDLIAKKYDDKLFKEYAITDLTRYQTGQIGLRWRTKEEVLNGKGETICSNKSCSQYKDLKTYEINFVYREEEQTKNALVKIKCCDECTIQLNFKVQKLILYMKKAHRQVKESETKKDIKRMLKKLEQRQKEQKGESVKKIKKNQDK